MDGVKVKIFEVPIFLVQKVVETLVECLPRCDACDYLGRFPLRYALYKQTWSDREGFFCDSEVCINEALAWHDQDNPIHQVGLEAVELKWREIAVLFNESLVEIEDGVYPPFEDILSVLEAADE